MKKYSVNILFLSFLVILCLHSGNGIAQTKETTINLVIPEGHGLITYYISDDGKTWGYLYGKLKENPKYDYDRYTEYYLRTDKGNVVGPLKYKLKWSNPGDEESSFWATDCELYVTPNGSYIILDMVDGGWTTVYNGLMLNYNVKKPRVIVTDDKIIIHCYEWQTNSLKIFELE